MAGAKAEVAVPAGVRELLRHTLATLAYRSGKTLRGAPQGFAEFQACASTREPGEILAHLADLFDWALSAARTGNPEWNDSAPLAWDKGVERFFTALGRFESYLVSGARLYVPPERLFQGPIADALTHVGQIAMLRRMAGAPVRGENYFVADIVSGRVGPHQSAPRREFD
ncbi:MAG: hypothetical protein ACR2IF_14900 [Terriglobales bacterium]